MNLEWINLLIGAFMPLVIAFVQRAGWNEGERAMAALVSCLVAAFALCIAQGQVGFEPWAVDTAQIWGTAVLTYKTWWQPTGIAPLLDELTGGRRQHDVFGDLPR